MLKKPYEYIHKEDLPEDLPEFVERYNCMEWIIDLFIFKKGQTLYFKDIIKEGNSIKRCLEENPDISAKDIAKHFGCSEQHVKNMQVELILENQKINKVSS